MDPFATATTVSVTVAPLQAVSAVEGASRPARAAGVFALVAVVGGALCWRAEPFVDHARAASLDRPLSALGYGLATHAVIAFGGVYLANKLSRFAPFGEGSGVVGLWFGLSLVAGQFRPRARPSDAADLSALAIFGGSERRATSQAFRSADLTAVFGGTSLDLRDAVVPDGETATITATALFGGVEIIVPRDWNVELDVLPILGGASDDRTRSERTHEGVDLVVTGFAAFGGVAVED